MLLFKEMKGVKQGCLGGGEEQGVSQTSSGISSTVLQKSTYPMETFTIGSHSCSICSVHIAASARGEI